MDLARKRRFLDRWSTYFPGADLPVVLYYTDEEERARTVPPAERSRCLICDLATVRQGTSRRFDGDSIRCGGGRRYLGFEPELHPNFAYFLSCGIPGRMEGERYKRSPQLVEDYLESQPPFEAPARYAVFKRWDDLGERDDPAVVIFFATADVLSGLFTLVNFNEAHPEAVIAPFGSGCASIVYHPYRELHSGRSRAVLGMFDVSARPCVQANVLTLAVPWPKLSEMMDQMDESFLTTDSWDKVRSRMRRASG